MTNETEKEKQRKKIAKDTEEFLRKGGKIDKVKIRTVESIKVRNVPDGI